MAAVGRPKKVRLGPGGIKKTCSKCCETKTLSEMYHSGRTASMCKVCKVEERKNYKVNPRTEENAVCVVCNKEYPNFEFSSAPQKANGISSNCRFCALELDLDIKFNKELS